MSTFKRPSAPRVRGPTAVSGRDKAVPLDSPRHQHVPPLVMQVQIDGDGRYEGVPLPRGPVRPGDGLGDERRFEVVGRGVKVDVQVADEGAWGARCCAIRQKPNLTPNFDRDLTHKQALGMIHRQAVTL